MIPKYVYRKTRGSSVSETKFKPDTIDTTKTTSKARIEQGERAECEKTSSKAKPSHTLS